MVEVQGEGYLVASTNSLFCSLLGKTREELLGKPFAEIVPAGSDCVSILDSVYQTGEAVPHAQEDDPEHNPAYWLHAMWPTLDSNGHPVRVIIQLTKASNFRQNATAINEALLIAGLHQHELTEMAENLNSQLRAEVAERKKTEAALGEAIDTIKSAQDAAERGSRAKDDFLAALSHELRTPLMPVLMAAGALREDERLPPDARDQLGMIERNIALEAQLIDDLLDLTKISLGKLQLRAQPCDAHHLISFAVEIIREDARAKEISIECAFNAQHSGLMADPTRFQQVVWNLLRNAVKFTPRGGRIFVSTNEERTGKEETWLRLEVSDSGIDPAHLDQIFRPLDQGGLTGDHRFGGVGLGLAIARAVVDLHGGRISAQSAGPDRGATFVVELPGAVESHPGVPHTSPALREVTPAFAPRRLLLVEDHESTLQTLARLLRRDGHHIATATSVAEALAAAAASKFDLVISDVGLPDGTGTELMEKLRAAYGLRGIALSGYGTEEDIVRSIDAGFVTHLIKPVSIAELRRVITLLSPA